MATTAATAAASTRSGLHKSIGWDAAHLTYDRADAIGNDAWWGVRPHVLPLVRAAECFIDNVNPDDLAPGVQQPLGGA